MKKLLVMLMLASTLTLCACGGNDEKVIGGDTTQSQPADGGAQTNNNAGSDDGANSGASVTASGAKGYVYTKGDVVVGMDMDAAPIVAALGEPASYFEATSCAFDGLDKIYTYNGFVIETYPQKDLDLVSSVTFKDDSVMTTEGVGIGDTMDRVTQVYGDATLDKGMLVYKKEGMKLCFIMQDDVVISVEYHSTILDE